MITAPYKSIDGIIVFHDDIIDDHANYHADGIDKIHNVEDKHFWFISRRNLILEVFEKFIPKDYSLMEVGAVTGSISAYLKQNGYTDIAPTGCGIKEIQQVDINEDIPSVSFKKDYQKRNSKS